MDAKSDYEIAKYIEAVQPGGDFNEILLKDIRWDVFYHLSPLRRSLFNWYPFKKGAALLEIGSAFGALTGLFCETCGHVTALERSELRAQAVCRRYQDVKNLEVYQTDAAHFDTEETYDYVILTGILEKQFSGSKQNELYISFLRSLQRFLKPDGKMLIAADNRYGLRYFCGARNPFTGRAFSGLNQYEEENRSGYSWGKKEFCGLLEQAGFLHYKFYYPLPDYRVPQLIYSDEYLPGSNVHERLVPYYEKEEPLLVDEKALYKDIAENQVFPFFANSFLAECSVKRVPFSKVNYAAVTTDRGKEHGFATVIRSDHTVRKVMLYPQGRKNLQQFFHNIEDIRVHGVDTVPHVFRENYVKMPYIHANPLSEDLGHMIKNNPEQFAVVISQLYQMILKSSDHLETKDNELARKYEGSKLADHISDEDYGVILKRAYIDMVPFNCFYQDGKFLFFDQEFVREGYPAKYTLFRALLYTYYFIPEAERIYPLAEMKRTYGLDQVWGLFEMEEQDFVSDNRNHQLYGSFYQWAAVDREQIKKRIALLDRCSDK